VTEKKDKYLKLFFTTFRVSAFTFGGGFVIIPLLKRKFVDELHWINEEEMLDLTAIAQSSPGAVAVNASVIIGYHVAGLLGALISAIATVLPPLVIISVISVFYKAFRDNVIVSMAMKGMLAGVAAVIFDVVINMASALIKQKRILPLLVMAAAFTASYFFKVNVIVIILVCALIGVMDSVIRERKMKGEER
jgi:chromate transporter